MSSPPPYISAESINSTLNLKHFISELKTDLSLGMKSTIQAPLRSLIINDEPFSCYGSMPALFSGGGIYMVKTAVFIEPPANSNQASVQCLVNVFSSSKGTPLAIIDGVWLTNLKCALLAGYTTDICSASNANSVGIIGSGVQARNIIQGVSQVRDLKVVKVFSRTESNMDSFIKDCSSFAGLEQTRFETAQSVSEAIRDVDIIGAATTTPTPLVTELSKSGVHINCMGAHKGSSREIDNSILEKSELIVEDLQTAKMELGSLHESATEVSSLHTLDVDNLRRKTTVFSSTGHASYDCLVAYHILNCLRIINKE